MLGGAWIAPYRRYGKPVKLFKPKRRRYLSSTVRNWITSLMRRFALLAALCLQAACATAGQGKTSTIAPVPLMASRTIFLSSLGSDEGANLIREKLRASLLRGQRWRVTEDSIRADVILAGSASNVDGQNRGTTDFAGTAILRLISQASKEALWLFEYQRGMCFSCSVSSRVSNQIFQALEGIPQGAR